MEINKRRHVPSPGMYETKTEWNVLENKASGKFPKKVR
jgi:hypothetical protein